MEDQGMDRWTDKEGRTGSLLTIRCYRLKDLIRLRGHLVPGKLIVNLVGEEVS